MTTIDAPGLAPARAQPFDLVSDPLPGPGTLVLEASAGTGKTYTLAGLVTRYVADGAATLDEMLLITFGRVASQELRERVRGQLRAAADALADPAVALGGDDALLRSLVTGPADVLSERRRRLGDALAGFDAATIATTHQFCQLVLRSLGVAGDSDAGVTLVESLDDLVGEIVDDLYLRRFGNDRESPGLSRAQVLEMATTVVANPGARLVPEHPEPGSEAELRVELAREVLAELERRKRRLGILGYDDLLCRLADALAEPDAPARERMRRRWRIVMVDEFQDTDPVQWDVIERAFAGHDQEPTGTTLVLIGDPKQAIYAFRGGDVATYLRAAGGPSTGLDAEPSSRTRPQHRTLDVNWRSDAALVQRLQSVMLGTSLGHPEIVVREVVAHHRGGRLVGAPCDDPFRLRVVGRDAFGMRGTRTAPMDRVRDHVAADLAADVAALLASGASYDARPLVAGDVAVIVEAHRDARACRDALAEAGVPAVYTGDSDVFASRAADDWLCLMEAFEQPHRSGLVRAAAASMWFGYDAAALALGGDDVTDAVSGTLRAWADHARERGVAAVLEAAMAAGMGRRILGWQGGERHLTDLAHLTELLHERAHRDTLGLPALLEWLRQQRADRAGAAERNRRLDSDAAAVQIMTVWVSKGLQFPVVYLPFAFNRNIWKREIVLHHDGDQRCLDIGGKGRPGYAQVEQLGRHEIAGDDIRLTYVALTRAQSQVVTWWAPSYDEPNGGLSRLLRGRAPGDPVVPDRCEPATVTDEVALARLRQWEAAGGPALERSVPAPALTVVPPAEPIGLAVRGFDRPIDTAWRRTSYSGLVRAAEETPGVGSEPEQVPLDDEADDLPVGGRADAGDDAAGADLASPMAGLPAGVTFGSLVHGVLETADPLAPDLESELAARVREQLVRWPVDAGVDDLARALVPLHDTPLGPLAPGLTLRDVGLADRLCELDFEIPLAGGDDRQGPRGPDVRLADVGRLLGDHLAADDPLASYAGRLASPGLGGQSLRGYLSGSIDVVLRVPAPDGAGDRYLVVDYKTNRLGVGAPDEPLTAADYAPDRVRKAMLHSDYPLQALLYTVVVHRFLRWRQPGYDPARHLGGVLYLYVRGMCGARTPVVDGHPAGVFSWVPPAGLVTALSDLLDRGRLR